MPESASRLSIVYHYFRQQLWVRVSLFALAAIVIAISPSLAGDVLPERWQNVLDTDSVTPVLSILASSMLAVSTFSLNIMVSAHRAAAGNATPRVHRLLREDSTTQSVLGVFIGAFVYSLITLILLYTDITSDETAVFIMAATIIIVIMVIVVMVRWIDHLSKLGSLDNSMELIEQRVQRTLNERVQLPAQGAVVLTNEITIPDNATDIPSPASGYVQIVDVKALSAMPEESGAVYVLRPAGKYVLKGHPLGKISGEVSEHAIKQASSCFVIGDMRTYTQDPALGLLALSEIGSKAMSPGINDPGTAIEVISRVTKLAWKYANSSVTEKAAEFQNVFMPGLNAQDMIEAGFGALVRDGAGTIEVALQLMQALHGLASVEDAELAEHAQTMADRLLAYAEASLVIDYEKDQLRVAANFT